MGILGVILSWSVIIFIWYLQGKARMKHEMEARLSHQQYIQDTILKSLGAMLALISKADGRISEEEVDVASRCLRSLGLAENEYQRCVEAFNSVKYPSTDMFRMYASDYASIMQTEARVLLYEMLWIVASADSVLDAGEDELLRMATSALNIDGSYYQYFKRRYFGPDHASGQSANEADSKVQSAYARLGCSPTDSDEALKSAYRKLAMRYHPDRLRAEGVPDGMIEVANRSMSEINAAWELIKRDRKIS